MGLRNLDLTDTVLSKISVDEFEPKTGKIEDVVVIGFHTSEEVVGNDIYDFINGSHFNVNDVEVSPNPNPDNYYIVFIEIPRDDEVLTVLKAIVIDIENLTGKLKWKVTTHLTDKYFPLQSPELEKYIITDPKKYMNRKDWEDTQGKQQMESKRTDRTAKVLEFLKDSSLCEATVSRGILSIGSAMGAAELKILGFGRAEVIMKKLGINESAINEQDSVFRKFNSMLGEMRAESIGEYIVIYHPHKDTVLVTKPC